MNYNIGEWSESYIFLKLIYDQKIDVADSEMRPLKDVWLKILSVIREGSGGANYRYVTGPTVRIEKDGVLQKECVPCESFCEYSRLIWSMISNKKTTGCTTFTDARVETFLKSIFADKVTAAAKDTTDITLETQDYKTGFAHLMGFSCKSDIDSASTLFNASSDNTNFEYEIVGGMTDVEMNEFNSLFHETVRKGNIVKDVATAERMDYLKKHGFDITFTRAVGEHAERNLFISGGKDMPLILAELLKYYYYEHNGSSKDGGADFIKAIEYAALHDVAGYKCENLFDIYRTHVSNLLYNMFVGMRLGTPWDGKAAVNGGYIVVKRDGSVVAYHSCIKDEFKNFLLAKLRLEAPSAKRHGDRVIVKREGKYFIKLALQVRFKLKSA